MATGRIGTTPVLRTRWSKEPAGGTTSLSGLDDNSVSLVYEVGYEAVYQNGALLSRGNDYTATDGTTITLTNATVAGDIIEVFANNVVPLTDTYSQSVADGKFVNNTLTTTTGDIIYASAANTPARLGIGSTGQVLKVSGGVPSWGADSAGALTLIKAVTYSGASNTGTDFHSQLTSTYQNYLILARWQSSVGAVDLNMQMSYGSTNRTATYYGAYSQLTNGTTWSNGEQQNNASDFKINYPPTNLMSNNQIWMSASADWGTPCRVAIVGTGYGGQNSQPIVFGSQAESEQSYDGFVITPASGTITGTVVLYGVQKS